MRLQALTLALAVLTSVAGCDGPQVLSVELVESAIPTAVNCGNGPQLRQRAADDRRRVDESRSDHERISVGSRANFLASLAVIADLKCTVIRTEADEPLKTALEAAHKAESTDSVYEKTRGYHQASFAATRAIDLMTERLPAPAAK